MGSLATRVSLDDYKERLRARLLERQRRKKLLLEGGAADCASPS